MQNVKDSETVRVEADRTLNEISDVVNEIKKMSPNSSREYIYQVVNFLQGVAEKYEEATKQEKRATASLLAAEDSNTWKLWETCRHSGNL